MISVVEVAGKQYCVQPGQRITVDNLNVPAGETIEVENKLNGEKINLTVVEEIRLAKVTSRKFRNKTRYTRTKGHRQPMTVLVWDQNAKTEAKSVRAKKTAVKTEEKAVEPAEVSTEVSE